MNGRALPLLSLPPSALMDCTSPFTGEVTAAFLVLVFSFSMSFFLVAILPWVVSTLTLAVRRSREYCRLVASSYVSSISFWMRSTSAF